MKLISSVVLSLPKTGVLSGAYYYYKDMLRLGDPDADLVLRVLREVTYVCCIHYIGVSSNWCDLLGGGIIMTWNAAFLILDKINSPNARPWRRGRF